MNIEVNKLYINAIGEVIFIKEYREENIRYPFRDERDYGYNVQGRYINLDVADAYDLICECVPDILAYYTANFITQKEFIQQHIDYYTKGKE